MQVELGDHLGNIQTDPGDEDLGGTKCLWLSGGKADNRENKAENIGILTKPSQSNTVYDGG